MKYTDTYLPSPSQASLPALVAALAAFVFLAFAMPQSAVGQPCESTASGDWSDSSIWTNCGGGFPDNGDNVLVKASDEINLNGIDREVGNLTLEDGGSFSSGTFVIFDGTEQLTISGDLTATGAALLDGDNDVLLSGANQTVEYPDVINRLETAAGLTLQLSSDLTVTDLIANGSPQSSGLTIGDASGSGTQFNLQGTGTTVSGDLTVNSGVILNATTNLNVGGDLTNNGTFETNANDLEVASASNGEFFNTGKVVLGANAALIVNGDFTNDTSGEADVRGTTLTLDRGNLTNSGTWTDGVTGGTGSSAVFRNSSSSGSQLTFNSGTLFAVEVKSDGKVNLGSDITVEDEITVRTSGQLGEGNTSTGEVLEDNQVTFNGKSFTIEFVDDSNKGFFFANKIIFNDDTSSSADQVNAAGEIFAQTQITNNAFVGLVQPLIVNDVLVVGNGSTLKIESSSASLTVNDDFTVSGAFDANSNLVVFEGGTNTGANPTTCDASDQTSDGDCEQDIDGGGGVLNFGPIEVRGDDTRVVALGVSGVLEIGTLTIDPGNASSNTSFALDTIDIEIGGSLINNGTFEPDTGTVKFSAGDAQTIDSTPALVFASLVFDNTSAAGLSISSGTTVEVTEDATVEDGLVTLDQNASLRIDGLLELFGSEETGSSVFRNGTSIDANATGSAVIIGSDGTAGTQGKIVYADSDNNDVADGSVVGNVISERALTQNGEWYFLASPIDVTYNGLLRGATNGRNNLWVQGPANSNAPGGNPSNIYYYDETDDTDFTISGTDASWTMVPDAAESIGNPQGTGSVTTGLSGPGNGFLIFAFSDEDNDGTGEGFPKVLQADGEPRFDLSFNFPVTNTVNTGTTAGDEGWNFLGNPYPTNIEWATLTKSNMKDTFYIFDPSSGNYTEGTSSTGEDFIAPFQGFFVEADGNSPSLSIDDITTTQSPGNGDPFFSASPVDDDRELTVTLEMGDVISDTHFSFRTDGTLELDNADARKLASISSSDRPGLLTYSLLSDGTGLGINNLPFDPDQEMTFPLEVNARGCEGGAPFSGEATLSFDDLRNVPDNWAVVITDTQTGTTIDAREQDASYAFNLSSEDTCSSQTVASQRVASAPGSPRAIQQNNASTRFTLTIDPDAGPLPVELNNFGGQSDEQDALLEWSTASETDNAGFEVEHQAPNADGFERISFVEGAGTTDEPQSYSFRASDLEAGTHTFRLRQVDLDGAKSLSEPVEVEIGLSGEYELSTYPNPVRDQATVQFAVKDAQPVTIEVYNTLGQRVRTILDENVEGDTTREVALDVNGLASGLYIVRMRGESFSTTQKVTVVR